MANRSLNRAQVIGHLGQDPDLKTLHSGMAVCNLSVATSESWTDKNTGELREETEWHRLTLWGKLAEIASQYLRKGDKVFLEGKLKTRKWQDQNGQERYTTEIHADNMLMLGGKNPGQGNDQGSYYARSDGAPRGQQPPAAGNGRGYPYPAPNPAPDLPFDDDIPF